MSKCENCEKYLNAINRIFDMVSMETDLYNDIVEIYNEETGSNMEYLGDYED